MRAVQQVLELSSELCAKVADSRLICIASVYSVSARLHCCTIAQVPCIGIVLGCEVDEPITQYESQLSVYQDRGIDLAALCAGTAVPISAIAPPMQATIQQRFNDSRDRFLQAIRTHSTESTVLLYETEMGLAKLIKNAWNHLVLFLGLGGKLSAISEPLWDLLKRLRVSDEIAIEMAVKVQG
eukprot:m.263275 g.263275  ORF g.263275 m.263275 type:complete len:183 (+) comp19706_c0_seq30:592-1140(+)